MAYVEALLCFVYYSNFYKGLIINYQLIFVRSVCYLLVHLALEHANSLTMEKIFCPATGWNFSQKLYFLKNSKVSTQNVYFAPNEKILVRNKYFYIRTDIFFNLKVNIPLYLDFQFQLKHSIVAYFCTSIYYYTIWL